MSVKKKRVDPDGIERLTFLMPVDAKRVLARISFETEVAMADIIRNLVDDYLMHTKLPSGVSLPLRLEQLRAARKERRA